MSTDKSCRARKRGYPCLTALVQGGDAVWEGLRVYKGRIAAFGGHLRRLQNSAKTLAFADVPSSDAIRQAVFSTLEANGMKDETHIRLTLTRGEKITSGMNPRLNQAGCSLIVLAEWKPPVYADDGIRVITSAIRRNAPQFLDSKIHHNNLLNNILAAIDANVAGADSAIMLDQNGFVSETNDTNLFMVRDGLLLTPFADACLPGLTRQMILDIADVESIPAAEKKHLADGAVHIRRGVHDRNDGRTDADTRGPTAGQSVTESPAK